MSTLIVAAAFVVTVAVAAIIALWMAGAITPGAGFALAAAGAVALCALFMRGEE